MTPQVKHHTVLAERRAARQPEVAGLQVWCEHCTVVTLLLQGETVAPAPSPSTVVPPISVPGNTSCGEVGMPEWQRHCLEHGLQPNGSLLQDYATSEEFRPLTVDDVMWPEDSQVGLWIIDTG